MIPILTIVIALGLGFLYSYFTKFLENVTLKLQILIGFLLVITSMLQIYIQYVHALQVLETLHILEVVTKEIKEGNIPLIHDIPLISRLVFDLKIILLLYPLAFMIAFSFHLLKNKLRAK